MKPCSSSQLHCCCGCGSLLQNGSAQLSAVSPSPKMSPDSSRAISLLQCYLCFKLGRERDTTALIWDELFDSSMFSLAATIQAIPAPEMAGRSFDPKKPTPSDTDPKTFWLHWFCCQEMLHPAHSSPFPPKTNTRSSASRRPRHADS